MVAGWPDSMPDMLVKLYDLPDPTAELAALRASGIECRRAESYERGAVLAWTKQHFPAWTDEVLVAFATVPATIFIAIHAGEPIGFACYNVTRPNFFGPTGVDKLRRGEGIGRALLLCALSALASQGYAYAIIGGVGPASFYEKAVGATLIEGSHPGIYAGRIGAAEREQL